MRVPPPHWPMFWTGLLMHLTFGMALLAFAIVFGFPLAWLFGEGTVAAVLALVAVGGRAVVGWFHAGQLWKDSAGTGLVLSTTISAGLVGYFLIFFPLAVLGAADMSGLAGTGLSVVAAMILDGILLVLATASGALIAAARVPRRGHRRLLNLSRLPVIREIYDSFSEHRTKTHANT